ncbi:MAG: hypothetical protein SGPRY_005235 [Prymnesium sp.]
MLTLRPPLCCVRSAESLDIAGEEIPFHHEQRGSWQSMLSKPPSDSTAQNGNHLCKAIGIGVLGMATYNTLDYYLLLCQAPEFGIVICGDARIAIKEQMLSLEIASMEDHERNGDAFKITLTAMILWCTR